MLFEPQRKPSSQSPGKVVPVPLAAPVLSVTPPSRWLSKPPDFDIPKPHLVAVIL